MIEKDDENRLFSNGEVILLQRQIHHTIEKSTEMFRMGSDGLREHTKVRHPRSIDRLKLPPMVEPVRGTSH